jgi:hypothetical protein
VKFKIILIVFGIIFCGVAKAQIHSVVLEELSPVNPDSIGVPQDSITEDPMTRTPFVIHYYSAIVFLNKYDTISHFISIRRNYKDQLLSIYNSNKMLPASRIYGFKSGHAFYRTAHFGVNDHVFALRIRKGKMNLFVSDRLWSAGEIDVRARTNEGIYHNRMLIQDADRNKIKRSDKDYFFTIENKFDSLKILSPSVAIVEMLKDNEQAANYVRLKIPKKGYRTARIISRALLATAILGTIITNGETENKYFKFALLPTGIACILTTAILYDPVWTENDVYKTVDLYNNNK